ncbi:response regulator transcription factor [Polaribacter sp. Hel1_33_78]|uniref:response regulator transcription factor n=1 Tax=Polaribacter sp. Hel1_33_78 TaxID=1336804 RepID=UPI0018D49F84|nr:LuxR C-terminal-related transcriptional regulator [Polaribacter sp. Hel1_33_78]
MFLNQIDSISIKKQDFENNLTYFEIQKLKAYFLETTYIKDEKKYLNKIHTFTKDSLQILAVKLISIYELNAKKLLDKDIVKNKFFYIKLLQDLKESDIEPKEYLFLENKLSKFLINEVETKYTYSKWLNIILGISLIGLFIFLVKSKRKETPVLLLSKQETIVKKMIIEGKSNKEIAKELFISLSTVKTHITNIYKKLNLSNRGDLICKFKNRPHTST